MGCCEGLYFVCCPLQPADLYSCWLAVLLPQVKILKAPGHAQVAEVSAHSHPHPSLPCLGLFQTLPGLGSALGKVQPVKTEVERVCE